MCFSLYLTKWKNTIKTTRKIEILLSVWRSCRPGWDAILSAPAIVLGRVTVGLMLMPRFLAKPQALKGKGALSAGGLVAGHDDLLAYGLGNLGVVVKLHCELASALRPGTKVRCIAEHLG